MKSPRIPVTRLLRVCPTCGKFKDMPFDLTREQAALAEPCPQCGFHFPVLSETPTSSAVFKDLVSVEANGASVG